MGKDFRKRRCRLIAFFVKKHTEHAVTTADADAQNAFKAAGGDTAAFEALVRKYEKFVCTTVYAVVQNYDDSFDVAQEVFLKLYHSIGSFRGESSFSSWLYRIARNTALDFVRRESARRTVSLNAENEDGDSLLADIPDTSDAANPEKVVLTNERKQLLYAAIESLSDEHREILLLRDIEGYTYEQIAEMLLLEVGTVKSRLFRAREALRKILAKNNYF